MLPDSPSPIPETKTKIAWSKRVSPIFLRKTELVCERLGMSPSDLMTCMAFETGRTFSPTITNAAGSGAVGLIQFMPSTAVALGTSTEKLLGMSAVEQLDWVERYFRRSGFRRWRNLGDVYLTILWPAAVGKTDDYVCFDKADPRYPKRYVQNAGLDLNRDGKVLRGEAIAKLERLLVEGLRPENA